MRNSKLTNWCLILLLFGGGLSCSTYVFAQITELSGWTFGGHSKYQYIHSRVPNDSVLQAVSGDGLKLHNLEVRLKASARHDHWDFNAQVQFIGVHSDMLSGFQDPPRQGLPGASVINDDQRWFKLTHEIRNQGKNAVLLRLDRINIAYTSEKIALRFGRQAISWGNGLLFTPMDIFNPFDPTAVDKEYKTGDDMLYGQYLLDNGNDVQAVAVVRRNSIDGNIDQGESSLAVKLHGFWSDTEYDVLMAEHYGDRVVGLGLATDIAGAIWQGDLVWIDSDSGSSFSVVNGVSYSWTKGGHNWTGLLEYYYNGHGQAGGDYSAASLEANPLLLQRLLRGEVFNLGRHYLGSSVMLEVTPLLKLSSNLLINLSDPSALAQLVLSHDWKENIQLLVALDIPIGPNGSEYGGIEVEPAGLYASTGPTLFTQLAWYF